MKYNENNKPMVCMMTQSTCYKGTSTGTPVGILWHDTAGGNPELRRYVQPDDNAANRAQMIQLLGKNAYNNDWNHINRSAGLNCWIGKLADGTITTVQTMPWNYRPWGCGSGSKGSCNGTTGGPFWIQFEICDDGYNSKTYFDKVYQEACEITAYLCDLYNINPKGTVNYKGVTVPTILCHWDSYKLGLGSGHSDVYGWFNKYNKTMDNVRSDVATLLKGKTTTPAPAPTPTVTPTPSVQPTTNLEINDLVSITKGATYYGGKAIPDWVIAKNWYVKSLKGDRVVVDKSEDGKSSINSPINIKYLKKATKENTAPVFEPYLIRVTASVLNVRSGPGTNYSVKSTVKKGGVYTIVDQNKNWGKLKSGAGWICLDYTEKK